MRWLLEERIEEVKGPEAREGEEQHAWWQVVCLTGVDYFSTLGYIPGIAIAAAGALSPIATLLIVLLTLFGMLPMYRVVAAESPHGQGRSRCSSACSRSGRASCSSFACLVSWRPPGSSPSRFRRRTPRPTSSRTRSGRRPLGIREYSSRWCCSLSSARVFLKGFREAIGIAVAVVGAYLLVNLVVVAAGFYEIATQPGVLADWQSALFSAARKRPRHDRRLAPRISPSSPLASPASRPA